MRLVATDRDRVSTEIANISQRLHGMVGGDGILTLLNVLGMVIVDSASFNLTDEFVDEFSNVMKDMFMHSMNHYLKNKGVPKDNVCYVDFWNK